jgi:hypothetical protein
MSYFNLSQATLCTTNPTWIEPSVNPGLRGERTAINRLSHGTAAQCDDQIWCFSLTNTPLISSLFQKTDRVSDVTDNDSHIRYVDCTVLSARHSV